MYTIDINTATETEMLTVPRWRMWHLYIRIYDVYTWYIC